LNDSELTKLKEKAKELTRVREKMRAVQEEVNVVKRQLVLVCVWHYLEQHHPS